MEKKKLKEKPKNEQQAAKTRMSDSNSIFITCIILILTISMYINLVFYNDKRSVKNGFANLFENYNYTPSNEIDTTMMFNSTSNIIKYIEFLSSPHYKEGYFNSGNFKFIGMMAVRTLQTLDKACAIDVTDSSVFKDVENSDKLLNTITEELQSTACSYNQYEGDKKKYEPIYYVHQGIGQT